MSAQPRGSRASARRVGVGGEANASPYATPLVGSRAFRSASGHARQIYSFVSADDVSSIYNTVATELWRRSFWREIPAEALGQSGAGYRDCDVILAQCHGRGTPFSKIGENRVQVINYLQGSKSMTLKAELAILLRQWLEMHPDEGVIDHCRHCAHGLLTGPAFAPVSLS